jgi:hypothetical protein
LSVLIVAGAVFLTLILYPLPPIDAEGIVAAIGELAPDPIDTGLAKLPAASDSSAIKLPVNVPVNENGTETAYEVLEQYGLPNTDPIVIETGQFWVMITSLVDGVHIPLEMVQRKVFAPAPSPVTVVVGLEGVEMVPVPLTSVHSPVPVEGAFPAMVAEVIHPLWAGPALAVVGAATPVMITSSVLGEHIPLEIVHLNVFGPTPSPVTVDVALVEVITFPAPLTRLHAPVPVTGVFPANVAEVAHRL